MLPRVEDEVGTVEPLAWQARTRALTELRAQLEALHRMLREAQERQLGPGEEVAVAELAQALTELAEAVRSLFGE